MMVRAAPPAPDVDYLLVRFFDFTATPGKKYRYRVRVLLEDPNRPQVEALAPRERALDEEVIKRLGDVAKEEEKQNRRIFYLFTDWSEPSEVVTISLPYRTLAGQIVGVREESIDKYLSMPTAEPSAKVMAIVWDRIRAVDVPAVLDAYRGTYLNFSTSADVIHPVTMQYKRLPAYSINTDRMLMDFEGGRVLPIQPKQKKDQVGKKKDDEDEEEEELLAPGEFLFMDENGNLFVRNELDDSTDFERYQTPEIEAPPEKDESDDGGGGGGMDMGMDL